jgi:hypothetical protein
MIILGGQIESISSRKDKTIKLTIGTQELNPNQAAELFNLSQQFCYLALKPEFFTKEEKDLLETAKTDLDTSKTPSQRLRGILYLNYEKDNEGYKDFTTYYISKMDKICDHYKTKLD